jgi:hypothetical protein
VPQSLLILSKLWQNNVVCMLRHETVIKINSQRMHTCGIAVEIDHESERRWTCMRDHNPEQTRGIGKIENCVCMSEASERERAKNYFSTHNYHKGVGGGGGVM